MTDPVAEGRAISDAPLAAPLDFDGLRKEGLDRLAKLAGRVWTDFNTHDPGVTLLEALVWGINELAYRAQFPVEDVLARGPSSKPLAGMALFTAGEILQQLRSPVTVTDWRKLVIDEPGVRNAWLHPAARPNEPIYPDRFQKKLAYDPPSIEPSMPAVVVRGVYSVQLDLEEVDGLGDLNDTTDDWKTEPPGEDPLVFDLALPRWDTWRSGPARLAWADPWLNGTVAGITLVTKTVVRPGLLRAAARVDVTPPAGGAAVFRTIAFDVRLSTVLRGTVTDRLPFIEAQLEQPGAANPLEQYRARVAAAFGVAARVDGVLQERRNLCEDFTDPGAARFDEVSVCADVDVEPGADLEQTAADLLLAFERVLGAPPTFRTLDALVSEGLRTEDIFSGPKLEHGFLLDEELDRTAPGREVHGSDLIAAAMDTQAVLAVRTLMMAAYADDGTELVTGERWRLKIGSGRVARLAPDRCKLVLYKNGIPFLPDAARVAALLAVQRKAAGLTGGREKPPAAALDLPVPQGRWRTLDKHVPVRFDLPRVYGVGRDGLPLEAGPVQHTQARQLQEFLLLFDQLLACGVEQVAHLDQLLSIDAGVTRTFFTADLRGQDPDLAHPLHKGAPPPARDEQAESAPDFYRRRNAFLDHLLARFDEPFAESAAWVAGHRRRDVGAGDAAGLEKIEKRQVESKAAFLTGYPKLSAERGRAFDVGVAAGAWPADALTGFERRVRHLLGIGGDLRRSLVDRFTFTATPVPPSGFEYRFSMKNGAGVVVLEGDGVYDSTSAVTFAAAAVERAAARDDRYAAVTVAAQIRFAVRSAAGQVLALSAATFASDADALAAAHALALELGGSPDTEGMHVIEHVLLRPQARGEALLEVTIDPSCPVQPQQADPYSLRATVVLPAWTGRFSDPAFRAFAEQTLRREAPAHVFLKICWVDGLALQALEAAWHAWLELYALESPPPAERAARLAALVDALSKLRNVYPVATLHDCKEDEGDNPLVLGRNQLGTMKPKGA